MHPQPFKIRHSLVLLFSLMLLSGCQPPASGESAGLRYPVLYMQLQQTTLPQQLPMPSRVKFKIRGVRRAVRDENIKELIFLPNAEQQCSAPRKA